MTPNTACSTRRNPTDRGTTLVLVLVFLVVAGLLVVALAGAAANGLHNTGNFRAARNTQGDARTAINDAIQSIRYTPLLTTQVSTLDASPPVACWQNTPSPPAGGYTSIYTDQSDGNSIAVWCSTAWYPSSAATRVVTFSACASTVGAAACAAKPLLQAVVTFDDYPSGGTTPPSNVACVTYCGTSMLVNSWTQTPTPPTVTSVGVGSSCPGTQPAAGPVTGNTPIVLCGTGFVNGGTTVEFIEESNGVPASDDTICSSNSALTPKCVVGSVNIQSSTQLTAVSPSIIEGSTYFVAVTTPSGTSAFSGDIYTYTAVTPTLASANPVSPTTGETVGGTEVLLSGTGFVSGSTVNFVEETNNAAVTPTVSVPATYVSVLSDTQLEAVAPPIYQGAYPTYFVEVVSPSGATSATSSADVFTYTVTTPTVSAVCTGTCTGTNAPSESASGPPGTTLTVYGTGFYSGETVAFNEEANGAMESQSFSGSNVKVLSASKLTVNVPTPTAGSVFFVNVTTPSPCNPNNGGNGAFCTSTNQAVTYSYPPTVSTISPSSTYAGNNITITGNYFANDGGNPTVTFEEESGGTLVSPPVTVTGTVVKVNNYQTITATVPQVAVGVTYFVTVATPGGVSWTSGTPLPPVFTYAAPTVTGVNPSSSYNNNPTITVNGTDFYTSGTTVAFKSNGTTVAGSNVTVTSNTQLSVRVPTLSSGTYDVIVTTPAGTSGTSNADHYTQH